ncbi:MAG: SOS response-associated peptidase [Ruminiclostridium sp.]
MCGRYAVFTEEENEELREIINNINERYKQNTSQFNYRGQKADNNVSTVIDFMKTGEIFPTDIVPVITGNLERKRVANLFKWGFPNYMKASAVIINARCESLQEKPTFRKLLTNGRCLVPASGFYEWKSIDQRKEKYLIRPTCDKLMYFAGLYNNFIDKNGLPFTSFVIITTEANNQMSKIHSRMPVILSGTEAMAWINPSNIEIVSNAGIAFNTEIIGDTFAAGIFRPYSKELIFEKVG